MDTTVIPAPFETLSPGRGAGTVPENKTINVPYIFQNVFSFV